MQTLWIIIMALKCVPLIKPSVGRVVISGAMYYMSDGPGTAVFGCQRTDRILAFAPAPASFDGKSAG